MRKRIAALLLALSLLLALCPAVLAEESQDCGARLLAITFDDGPGPYTDGLLDELAARGVKATFFTAGYCAVNYPETLKRIVDEGHQLASHTYNHYDLNTLSADSVRREMESTQALITAAGGSTEAYIRPPYGNANATVKSVASVPLVYWSVDPEDWKYRDADTVRRNIVSGSYDGAIILVHDIHKTSVAGALAAIDELMSYGYEFCTVEELLLRRGIDPQPGVMYYDAKNKGVNLPAEQVGKEGYDESRITEHWGYDALNFCISSGYMDLTEDGRWAPNRYVIRGDFVTALGKACGVMSSYPTDRICVYGDVSSLDLRAPYIMWAYDAALMIGSGSNFEPENTLTREQMATVVARYLSARGDDIHVSSLRNYADSDKISSWAEQGIRICTGAGLLQGAGGRFNPKGKLTRAEIATVLQRLCTE